MTSQWVSSYYTEKEDIEAKGQALSLTTKQQFFTGETWNQEESHWQDDSLCCLAVSCSLVSHNPQMNHKYLRKTKRPKRLEEAYQKGVNKEHKPNPARTHPMSSWQGKGHQEMPANQTETAQYSQDSQSDSDQDFEVTAVRLHAESTRLDRINSHPQDSHEPCHMRLKTNDMDQHGQQGTPGGQQGHYASYSWSPASQEYEIRHLWGELDQAQRDTQSMSNDIRELVAGIRDLSSRTITAQETPH